MVMECLRGCIGNVQDASYEWMCGGSRLEYGSEAKENNMWCDARSRDLFYHRIVVIVPILFMKRLLTICGVPVSDSDGFHGIIPELALLPPIDLFGNELGGFEGRGRDLRRPGTLRRMTIRVCTDATFVCLRPLWLWSRGNILCYVWGTKSGGAAFTTPLGPVIWSSALAICLRSRSGTSRPPCPFGGCSTTGSPRPSVSSVKIFIFFLLFILIAILLEHEAKNGSCSAY